MLSIVMLVSEITDGTLLISEYAYTANVHLSSGTLVMWFEEPMREWSFWEGQRGPSAERSRESCHYPHTPKNLLGFARILWPCLSAIEGGGCAPCAPPPPVATLLHLSVIADHGFLELFLRSSTLWYSVEFLRLFGTNLN